MYLILIYSGCVGAQYIYIGPPKRQHNNFETVQISYEDEDRQLRCCTPFLLNENIQILSKDAMFTTTKTYNPNIVLC